MKRIISISLLLLIGYCAVVGERSLHQKRFRQFMLDHEHDGNVEYSDAGCEFGWKMTSMFVPQSGPNGKNRLMKLWMECDSINENTKGEFVPFDEWVKTMPNND